MGRIVASVDLSNAMQSDRSLKIDALVDTGAGYLTLPLAWKDRLGTFGSETEVELHIATQEVVEGIVCGPVRIEVEGFRAIYNEVLFVEMHPDNGKYEPLVGYIVLEQSGIAVDMIGHRLLPVRYIDAKSFL